MPSDSESQLLHDLRSKSCRPRPVLKALRQNMQPRVTSRRSSKFSCFPGRPPTSRRSRSGPGLAVSTQKKRAVRSLQGPKQLALSPSLHLDRVQAACCLSVRCTGTFYDIVTREGVPAVGLLARGPCRAQARAQNRICNRWVQTTLTFNCCCHKAKLQRGKGAAVKARCADVADKGCFVA